MHYLLIYNIKEGNVLFNNILNTFYFRLYGIEHMVKDHSDSKRWNWLPPLRGLIKFFYMHHPRDRIAHITAFITLIVEQWLEGEIAIWVHHKGSIQLPTAQWVSALTTEIYLKYYSYEIKWLVEKLPSRNPSITMD